MLFQIISGESYDPIKVDLWSSGITLYAMLCGYLPFDEESKTALYDKILACKFALPKYLSSSACDLLKMILTRDPARRPSMSQILSHAWFSNQPIVKELSNNEIDLEILRYAAGRSGKDERLIKDQIKNKEIGELTML